MSDLKLEAAYTFCLELAQSHYENFPVASVLLPKRLRRPISVIYAFARTADDFADEGNLSQTERLDRLNGFSQALDQINQGRYQGSDPIFLALKDVISCHRLPLKLFEDLLTAFKQDVVKSRYADFNEVLNYCRYSANPVGRLLLHLAISPSERQLQQSDAVCTALQLINFYQDIVQDYREQDRIYIPQQELSAAGLKEHDLVASNSESIAVVVRSLYQHTSRLMQQGYLLGVSLNGRLGWEVRAMTLGGITTLHHLSQQTDDNLLSRPRLTKQQMLLILFLAACPKVYSRHCEKLFNSML